MSDFLLLDAASANNVLLSPGSSDTLFLAATSVTFLPSLLPHNELTRRRSQRRRRAMAATAFPNCEGAQPFFGVSYVAHFQADLRAKPQPQVQSIGEIITDEPCSCPGGAVLVSSGYAAVLVSVSGSETRDTKPNLATLVSTSHGRAVIVNVCHCS